MTNKDISREQIVEELTQTMNILREIKDKLAEESKHFVEVNNALRVLLKERGDGKIEFQENILANVQQILLPSLVELKKSQLSVRQVSIVNNLELNLNEILSPFVVSLSSSYLGLTPRELRVAHLIKDGLTTKEIAALLCLSEYTIKSHRFSIRRKLKLTNMQINLTSYLRSLQK